MFVIGTVARSAAVLGLCIATTLTAAAQTGSFPPDQVLVAPSGAPAGAPSPVPAYAPPPPDKLRVQPEQLLVAIITQLQTGNPPPSWYGPAFWQMILSRTGNTGYDRALAELGAVTKVSVVQVQMLPQGAVYGMVATHQGGLSSWSLAVSNQTNRVEYGAFALGNQAEPTVQPTTRPSPIYPVPEQSAPPSPPQGPIAQGPASPSSVPENVSAACRKFPNLC